MEHKTLKAEDTFHAYLPQDTYLFYPTLTHVPAPSTCIRPSAYAVVLKVLSLSSAPFAPLS